MIRLVFFCVAVATWADAFSTANVICSNVSLVPPTRPNIVVLCSGFCQSPKAYSTPPADPRERATFELALRAEERAVVSGGNVQFVANIQYTTTDAAAVALVKAVLAPTQQLVGTVIAFSDLKILALLPEILADVSTDAVCEESNVGQCSTFEPYVFVVVDQFYQLASGSAFLPQSAVTNDDIRRKRMMASLEQWPQLFSTYFLSPVQDVVGYQAGVAVGTYCAQLDSAMCHVAVLLPCASATHRILRAGFNVGLNNTQPNAILSGAFVALADDRDELISTVTSALEWIQHHKRLAVDVVVVDGSMAHVLPNVSRLFLNTTTVFLTVNAVGFSQLTTATPNFIVDVSANISASVMPFVTALLSGDGLRLSSFVNEALLRSKASRCALMIEGHCSAFILRQARPLRLSWSNAFANNSVATAMTVAVNSSALMLRFGSQTTEFDYLLNRRTSSFPPDSLSPLATSIRRKRTFGATTFDEMTNRTVSDYLVNPAIAPSPLEDGVSLIVVALEGRSDGDNTSTTASFMDAYMNGTLSGSLAFYYRNSFLAVFRYDVVSDSLDRMSVVDSGGHESNVFLAPLFALGVSIPTTATYESASAAVALFGGSRDVDGSLSDTLLIGTLTNDYTTRWSVVARASDPLTPWPSPRTYSDMAAGGGMFYLYGGMCNEIAPCNDLWSLNISTLTWKQLFPLASTPVTSPFWNGRYLHTLDFALYANTPLLLVSGGKDPLHEIFAPWIYNLTSLTWSAFPVPNVGISAAWIPCVQLTGQRVVFTVFDGFQPTLAVFNLVDRQWGSLSVADWEFSAGRCARAAAFSDELKSFDGFRFDQSSEQWTFLKEHVAATTTVIASSGFAHDNVISMQEYALGSCSLLWASNMHSSASGQGCDKCVQGFYADNPDHTTCVACPVTVGYTGLTSWQKGVCYKQDYTGAAAGFSVIVFLQVVAVPILYIFSSAITRSEEGEKDEFAVTELSEAIAEMMLERVAFLDHVEHPTKLQEALQSSASNIKLYRKMIPTSILTLVDYVVWKEKLALNNGTPPEHKGGRSVASGNSVVVGVDPIVKQVVGRADSLRSESTTTASINPTRREGDITHRSLTVDVEMVSFDGPLPLATDGSTTSDDELSTSSDGSNTTSDLFSSSTSTLGEDDEFIDDDSWSSSSSSGTSATSGSTTRTSTSLQRTSSSASVPAAPPSAGRRGIISVPVSRKGSFSVRQAAGISRSALPEPGASLIIGSEAAASGFGSMKGSTAHSETDSTTPLDSIGQQPQEAVAPRLSVANCVLAALQPNLTTKNIVALFLRLDGFSEWHQSFTSQKKFAKKLNRVVDAILEVILEQDGVPETFFGDGLFASWNTVMPSQQARFRQLSTLRQSSTATGSGKTAFPSSQESALLAAHAINSNPLLRSTSLRVSIGVGQGKAKVGIVGGDGLKRFAIHSPVQEQVVQLSSLCRQLEASVLVEWTRAVRNFSKRNQFVFRVVGEMRITKATRDSEHLLSPTAHEVRQKVSLLAELLGPSSSTQWKYELKGHPEHMKAYNRIVESVFIRNKQKMKRSTGEAADGNPLSQGDQRGGPPHSQVEAEWKEKLTQSIPKTMPKWYQTDLQQLIQCERLHAVHVSLVSTDVE